ncbi:maleylpyruvate isomerase family mycothiol-dependent enzyme [Nocardia takedensis]|uniref:maleylpyruvate isomerase family mycothiol-dependent enzyme n=1 Tax=Nocardia takedensis TaxID=259390 RepID=UPI0002DE83D4|nr:maleylpyruvate isomerase family mycothiol-dependent enzyme [Nocardia takedensis]
MSERERVVGALVGQWRALRELVEGFDPAQWAAPSPCPGWTAHDVLAHIVGTESILDGAQAPEPTGTPAPYVRNEIGALNQRWVDHFRALSDADLLDRFDTVVAARTAALTAMTDAEFDAPSWTPEGPGTYAKFMRIRVFDCWTHEQDLREIVARPGGTETEAAEIALEEMVGKLGYIVGKRAAAPAGSTVTVILTGPLGRTVPIGVDGRARVLDAAPENPTVTLTLPAPVFARLYGGRVTVDEIADSVRVQGDHLLGHRVLEASAITM